MPLSIDTPKGNLTRIQVIWDATHGRDNAGWYLRTISNDQEQDERLDSLDPLSRSEPREVLAGIAARWVMPPDLTADELADLQVMIEVRR